jgi:uncharacterized membrane protein
MKSRIVVAGHSLHVMLVAFPLGLLCLSPLWDLLRLSTPQPAWGIIGFWTIFAGVVSALVAAVPGLIDFLAIPTGTRAKLVGLRHLQLNLTLVGLFTLSLVLRKIAPGGYQNAGIPQMLPGWFGVVVAGFSAWMGSELVETLGIGVHDGANPNAPSSLDEEELRAQKANVRQAYPR